MAQAGRISGKDLKISLNGVSLEGDFTSVSVSWEEDLVEATAGADTFHYYITTGRKNGTVDIEAFYDSATTTVWNGIAPGTSGTLIIYPKGSGTGNPMWTWSDAIVQTRDIDMPYDDAITVTATIQLNGTLTESTVT